MNLSFAQVSLCEFSTNMMMAGYSVSALIELNKVFAHVLVYLNGLSNPARMVPPALPQVAALQVPLQIADPQVPP
jgi:hypothetical protein